MPKPRTDVDGKSTSVFQIKLTPRERGDFHTLAWFREKSLAELVRGLLKADMVKAEAEGMWTEVARTKALLEVHDRLPARKKRRASEPAKKRKG